MGRKVLPHFCRLHLRSQQGGPGGDLGRGRPGHLHLDDPGQPDEDPHLAPVPLSTQAKELLAHARDHTDLSENRIFPLQRGDQYITNATLSKLLEKLAIPTVPHGFRSSFRIWAGEQGNVSEPTAEMALAHRPTTNIERELMTSDFLEERQALMQAWADYLTSTMGPVTPTTEE